jgi:hypothetical protein
MTARSYEAINDLPRLFIAYGGTVADALRKLADELETAGVADVEPVAVTYSNWDGEHSLTAVVSV